MRKQVFQKLLPPELIKEIVGFFGIYALEKRKSFQNIDLEKLGTLQKMKAKLPELRQYYYPCKAKLFLNEENLTLRRAITILRQIISIKGLTLEVREKFVKKAKILIYTVVSEDREKKISISTVTSEIESISIFTTESDVADSDIKPNKSELKSESKSESNSKPTPKTKSKTKSKTLLKKAGQNTETLLKKAGQ